MVPLSQKSEKRTMFVVGMKKIKDPLNIWNLGTHEFRYDFTIFFIYMNSYMNS